MNRARVVCTGGGTGGHIIPLVAVVREIRKQNPDPAGFEFVYIGPRDDFGGMILSQEGFVMHYISTGKLRRYWSARAFFQNMADMFIRVPWGFLQSFVLLFRLAPDLIFSKGGHGALPVVLAGKILGIPIFLHESDAEPGLANRIAGRVALEVFVSFPRTKSFSEHKTVLVGNPIRLEILEGNGEEARRIFQLQGGKPVLLLMGGSQGSQRLNDMLLNVLNEALSEFEIIHQTGEKNFEQAKKEAEVVVQKDRADFYHPVAFMKETDLKHAYATCDLVVNRAGAGSVFEIAALGKPSILIPLAEAAQNHQIVNAYEYAQSGACIVLEEINLTPRFFLEKLRYLFSHGDVMEAMAKSAKAFAKPDAARLLASYIVEYLAK
ncbi:MAG: UDP-N-acetylglucosamine--N-acetylmuramyl-(pentapeptide) pyrophosphoryl-undecaprenol N-acetylglucosamine transferase [Candidatus Wildermuthbacteria bacterium]|nr:UDP-N-acetylglucosamine--N-acetylmuramyl-(pentapeptide) pyrophosphoryl-undecaprenol N-acetylglucosamine transferase [Candidatus Wildermuthbacteria bacterium]